jgi:hypothetical protein
MKTPLLTLISISTLIASGIAQDTPKKSTNTLEFLSQKDKKERLIANYNSTSFYYGNAKDEASEEPHVAAENNIKFLEIKGLKQIPLTKWNDTQSTLIRYIKIPDNAPEFITVSFFHRYKKEEVDKSWIANTNTTNGNMTIRFGKDGILGGGYIVALKKNAEWQKETHKLRIPSNAKYLIIELKAYIGEAIGFGNWTIE